MSGQAIRFEGSVDPAAIERLHGTVDHLVHLAAVYDMTADDAANEAANVGGTANVVAATRSASVRAVRSTAWTRRDGGSCDGCCGGS